MAESLRGAPGAEYAADAAQIDERVQAFWSPLRPLLEVADLDRSVPQRVEVDRFEPAPLRSRLAELAFWVETVVPVIADLHGSEIQLREWYGGDEFEGWPDNAGHRTREAAWASLRSREQILARLDEAHARMRRAVATLTAAEVTEPRSVMGGPPGRIEQKVADCVYGPYEELARQLADR